MRTKLNKQNVCKCSCQVQGSHSLASLTGVRAERFLRTICYYDYKLNVDKRIPQGERIACVAVFTTPSHGQPHTVFRGFISLSGGRILLRKEIMAKNSAHVNIQCITSF